MQSGPTTTNNAVMSLYPGSKVRVDRLYSQEPEGLDAL